MAVREQRGALVRLMAEGKKENHYGDTKQQEENRLTGAGRPPSASG